MYLSPTTDMLFVNVFILIFSHVSKYKLLIYSVIILIFSHVSKYKLLIYSVIKFHHC